MADAWGGSFGTSWADSWTGTPAVSTHPSWACTWLRTWGNSWGDTSACAITPVVVPDTHDGGFVSRREYDEIRKRIRRAEKSREQSDKQRRKAEQRLKESVERAYRKIVEGLPDPEEVIPELISAAEIPTIASDGIVPFVPDFAALTQDLAAMSRLVAAMEERARDEDDIELLLLAL